MALPVEHALEVLDDRWKPLLVWHLFWGGRPFSELMRVTSGITRKTLRRELGAMEASGLVRRELQPGGGRRALYSLTAFGETLKPVVGAMYEWGLAHRPRAMTLAPRPSLRPFPFVSRVNPTEHTREP
jgi:DNA-binding HxlR family transcriptional regulator